MKILVVDNDPNFLMFMEKFLTVEGHEVHTALDGLSAMDIVESVTHDFIFVDYIMPNIDGGVLCRIFKNTRRLGGSFIVLLSAVAAEEWVDCLSFGADACVAKSPFGRMKKDLLEVISDPAAARSYCADGNVFGLDAISPRGITEELLTSKKHYNSLLNKMSEGIFELNAKNRIVYANPSSLKILDKTEHEILGLSIFDLFPGRHGEQIEKILENRDRDIANRANGQLLPLENKFLVLKLACLDGSPGHSLLIVDDITDLKKTENDLRETNNILNGILDSSNSFSVILTDLRQNIVFWNSGAENIFGYSADEVVGKKKITILYPEGHDNEMTKLVRDSIVKTRGHLSFETRELARDGKKLWMKVHLSPRLNENGEVIGILGIGENITEIKIMEEEKEELQTQLLRSQKLESILTLAGGVAHDFNNLLMGIQGHVSLASLELQPDSPLFNHLNAIENLVQTGAALTNQLLSLARGGKNLAAAANMNAIVENAVELFKTTRKNIDARVHLSDDLWGTEIDKKQMEQVLMNICTNSWEAMNGSGTLTIETKNRELKNQDVLPYKIPAGKYIEISISDNGAGMDKHTLEKIFDPFFTTKNRSNEKGAGLGLAYVYRTIKNHDGMIKVQSRPGKGSVFKIYLPAAECPAKLPDKSPGPRARGAVMIVDDEELTLEVSTKMLEKLGYKVFPAGDGVQATDILKTHKNDIDLVILDLVMPGYDGGDVFRDLMAIDPDCKVLLSSGYSRDGEAEKVLNMGCRGFIQKPFNLDRLSEKIRSIIDR